MDNVKIEAVRFSDAELAQFLRNKEQMIEGYSKLHAAGFADAQAVLVIGPRRA